MLLNINLATDSSTLNSSSTPLSVRSGAVLGASSSVPQTIIEKIIARSIEAGADPYKMTEIANCESDFNPKAKNIVKANPALKIKAEHSIGIFQINTAPDAHPEYDRLLLEEVDYNIEVAMQIWKQESYQAWSNCLAKHLARK